MLFLYDNIVAIQAAAVCAAFAWLYGGTDPSALMPTIPWMLAILFELALCFPQRHAGETTYEARARVWRRVGRDPLTWMVIAFVVMLMVPFFNLGRCPICSYPEIAFDAKPEAPPIPMVPFCVDRTEHLTVVMWFVPALTAMLVVKHALLKRGKRILLELVVWNGFLLSLVGMLQAVTGAEGPLWRPFEGGAKAYFFSTFGYPNMAGDYFTTLFGLAVGLWRWKVDAAARDKSEKDLTASSTSSHKAFWRKHLLMIPALVFFFSAMMTLSRAAILLSSLLAIVFFVHTLASFLKRMKKVKRVKVIAVNLIVLVLIATVFFVFISDNTHRRIKTSGEYGEEVLEEKEQGGFREDFRKELGSVDMTAVLERTSGSGQYHVRVAFNVWKDHPFFGCGGWGYKHFCIPKMTDEEYENLQVVGGINVHNDYMQFLAEHGAVGLLLFLSFVVALVLPLGRVWKALIAAVRFTKPKDQPPKPIAIFALPAPVFCILATAIATLLHALGDCPFRSPAVLTLFFVSLASMDGFMPRLKNEE